MSIGLAKNIKNLTHSNLERIRDNLLDLSVILAENGIVVDWDLMNIGMTNKVETKYYLDLERIKLEKQTRGMNIQKIHFQSVMNMFVELLGNRGSKNSVMTPIK